MNKHLSAIIFILAPIISFASDVEYTHSQSSSSSSDKLKMNYTLDSQNKLGVSYKTGKDTSGVSDDSSYSLKGSYKHKFEGGSSLTTNATTSDEGYYYEGKSLGVKYSVPVYDLVSDDKKSKLTTKLNLGIDLTEKKYSKIKTEYFQQRTLNIGLDQELSKYFSVGVDFSMYSYSSGSTQTKKALDGTTVIVSDINNYTSSLSKSSSSISIDYSDDKFSAGYSLTLDQDFLGSGKYLTHELYGDVYIAEVWIVGLSVSNAKAQGSTTATTSYGFSLGYSFK